MEVSLDIGKRAGLASGAENGPRSGQGPATTNTQSAEENAIAHGGLKARGWLPTCGHIAFSFDERIRLSLFFRAQWENPALKTGFPSTLIMSLPLYYWLGRIAHGGSKVGKSRSKLDFPSAWNEHVSLPRCYWLGRIAHGGGRDARGIPRERRLATRERTATSKEQTGRSGLGGITAIAKPIFVRGRSNLSGRAGQVSMSRPQSIGSLGFPHSPENDLCSKAAPVVSWDTCPLSKERQA